MAKPDQKQKVIIIGGGPAGLTAAIYTARANLKPLVAVGSVRGTDLPGGQLMLTTDVENYPGFENGIMGPDLMEKLGNQAKNFGAVLYEQFATEFDLSKQGGPFKVKIENEWYETEVLILANGASARWLGAPGEEKFINKGISACATCDGPLGIFRNKHIAVVGGGDSACEEALFLTRFASKVSMLIRTNKLRASKIMQQRVVDNEKIEILWNTEIKGYKGDDLLSGIMIQSGTDLVCSETLLEVAGVFMAIGHTPNTEYLKGSGIEMDEAGYIKVTENIHTNIDGVFAAGDNHDTIYRQAITAAGFGCQAGISAERWLEEKQAKL